MIIARITNMIYDNMGVSETDVYHCIQPQSHCIIGFMIINQWNQGYPVFRKKTQYIRIVVRFETSE